MRQQVNLDSQGGSFVGPPDPNDVLLSVREIHVGVENGVHFVPVPAHVYNDLDTTYF